MAGRRRFDEDAALDAAMRLFWEKGFEGASVAALEDRTGLNKSSLYNAWTSKEALYDVCLRRFSARYGAHMAEALRAPTFAAALSGLFERLLARFEDEDVPDGCLTTMATMEAGDPGGPGGRAASEAQEAMRRALAERIERAVGDGDAPTGVTGGADADQLAAAILAQARGLAVLNRSSGGAALARDAAKGFLAALGVALGDKPEAAG